MDRRQNHPRSNSSPGLRPIDRSQLPRSRLIERIRLQEGSPRWSGLRLTASSRAYYLLPRSAGPRIPPVVARALAGPVLTEHSSNGQGLVPGLNVSGRSPGHISSNISVCRKVRRDGPACMSSRGPDTIFGYPADGWLERRIEASSYSINVIFCVIFRSPGLYLRLETF